MFRLIRFTAALIFALSFAAYAGVNLEDGLLTPDTGHFAARIGLSGVYKDVKDFNTVKEPVKEDKAYADIFRPVAEFRYSLTDRVMLALDLAGYVNSTEDRSGIQKTNLEAYINLLNEGFKLDVIAGFSPAGFFKGEMDGLVTGTLGVNAEQIVKPKNYSYGMHAALFGFRAGAKASDRLSFHMLFEGTYRFSKTDSLEAEIDASGASHPLAGPGSKFTAKATLQDILDTYTQIGASYSFTDDLHLNLKAGYQMYSQKIVKDVKTDSTNNANKAIANGMKVAMNDGFTEVSFGGNVIYNIADGFTVGPQYLFVKGHNDLKALQTRYRMEYGLVVDCLF